VNDKVVIALPVRARGPSRADHVALRSLIKYASSVLEIPYKQIAHGAALADGSKLNESNIKNYVNDKASRSEGARGLFEALLGRCSQLISERPKPIQLDEFAVALLIHLLGVDWLNSAGIELPASRRTPPTHDAIFADWLGVPVDMTAQIETRYVGLWRVMRASSPKRTQAADSARFEIRDINNSLLNIRPRSVTNGVLCDFRWYYLGRDREPDEYTVFEGYVVPTNDRIEFLGRSTTGHSLLSLMVWRFTSNRELRRHATVSNGAALSLNSDSDPVGARLRAFFVGGTEQLTGEGFDRARDIELGAIGVKPIESIRSMIPQDQFERTVSYLSEYKPIVGFSATREDTSD
jgi:hypothetical protein